MSGHNKWSKIKNQKGTADAKRGTLFTKLTREIILAVRQGGPSQEGNFKLRLAIEKAKDASMPYDNIDRAIKRGSGTLDGATLEEMIMEGYSAGGAAVLVQAVTDNRNRTISDIRSIFTRNGGSLGAAGCVAWIFENKGVIAVRGENLDADDIALKAIDAGADDVKIEKDYLEIYTTPEKYEEVKKTLQTSNVPIISSELSMTPKTTIKMEEKGALQTLKLLDRLEELDEVQSVSSNADFSDDVLEKFQAGVS